MYMLNFPVPYSEELLYSTVARAGVRHGLTSPKQLLDEIFHSRSVVATIDLPNHLAVISRLLPHDFTAERLIQNHTLFPLYAPFVPERRRRQCIEWMRSDIQGAIHLALGVAASRIKLPRHLRYCPGCVIAQREQHGEYFWLREWQVAGIESCPRHGALVDTRVARPLVERHRFLAASPEHCPSATQKLKVDDSCCITAQVRQLLTLPEVSSPTYDQWTAYYRNLAYRLHLCRGKVQIDHSSIRAKVLDVLPKLWPTRRGLISLGAESDESSWLKAIFRKHRKSFNYLEHMVVHHALLGSDWHVKEVLAEVMQFAAREKPSTVQVGPKDTTVQTQYQEDWRALLIDRSPKQARHAAPALYARLYRNHHDWLIEVNQLHETSKSTASAHRVDWDKRDWEYLQALRQLVTFLTANPEGPRRSRTYYLKLLGNLPTLEKNLYRMPLFTAFLDVHTENVSQYQIRRLQNAHEDLHLLFDFPPRWRLLRSAGLSEERLTDRVRQFLENLMDTEHEVQRRRKE